MSKEPSSIGRRRLLGMLGGSALSSLAGCRRLPQRQLVFVLTVDSLRASRIGVYGYPRPTTPVLDALAGQSFRFTHARSECSWTKPSVASLFLARPVREHLVVFSMAQELRRRSIRETLRKVTFGTKEQRLRTIARGMSIPSHLQPFHKGLVGFKKAALVNNPHLGPDFGFDQGWDLYQFFPPKSDNGRREATSRRPLLDGHAGEINRRALLFIDDNPGDDVYIWMHHNDVHWPYGPVARHAERFGAEFSPEKFRLHFLDEHRQLVRRAEKDPGSRPLLSALYDAGLRSFDDELGLFLQTLRERGLFDAATIVVTSDHGEAFWEHGDFGHGADLFDVTASIPLLVKLPYQTKGGVVAESTSLIDVGPTVLDLAGRADPSLPGRSLLPVVADGRSYERSVVSELVRPWGNEVTLVRPPHKLRLRFSADTVLQYVNRGATGSCEPDIVQVYDLVADSAEVRPITPSQEPALVARLREELHAALGGQLCLHGRLLEEVAAGRGARTLPLKSRRRRREIKQQLRALGYL